MTGLTKKPLSLWSGKILPGNSKTLSEIVFALLNRNSACINL